jgi:hypothetical protein
MIYKLLDNEVFGLIKPSIDAHTLGITTIGSLLKDCGYEVFISPVEISAVLTEIYKLNNISILQEWILSHHITRLGFSYRLDPQEACDYFCKLYYQLKENNLFVENGGTLRGISFAGLPDACRLIQRELSERVVLFIGDETPTESLDKLGVPQDKFPRELQNNSSYDLMRWNFAKSLIESETYKNVVALDHLGYPDVGTATDSYVKRLNYCYGRNTLPIIRAHVGPYNPIREEGVKEFTSWVKTLASTKLLDVLSIGTSQLTQSHFGENWDGLPNGGGVPINSEIEYSQIKDVASPMLLRTYAGTKNVPAMAQMHERYLNIAWHALSFWWFSEIDGRGANTVYENLKEHIETVRYIASTGKPLEPNVPHHFAFRGSDDITYIISGFLAAKTAKRLGIKYLILQNMLNTPKYTWGIQDLAKGRVMLRLVRELEDSSFKVSLQTRAGLDFFSPDLEKAKIQLAATTALMDDLEPNDETSPQIIHVVSYSEAVRLATPPIINESIQITMAALKAYRKFRRDGKIENMEYNRELSLRVEDMYEEAKEAIEILEKYIPNLYTAEGLFKIFKQGFFPVPYMIDEEGKYSKATNWLVSFKNGGIRVVDENNNMIRTADRYKKIISQYEE